MQVITQVRAAQLLNATLCGRCPKRAVLLREHATKMTEKSKHKECLKHTCAVNKISVSRQVLKGAEVYLTEDRAC